MQTGLVIFEGIFHFVSFSSPVEQLNLLTICSDAHDANCVADDDFRVGDDSRV